VEWNSGGSAPSAPISGPPASFRRFPRAPGGPLAWPRMGRCGEFRSRNGPSTAPRRAYTSACRRGRRERSCGQSAARAPEYRFRGCPICAPPRFGARSLLLVHTGPLVPAHARALEVRRRLVRQARPSSCAPESVFVDRSRRVPACPLRRENDGFAKKTRASRRTRFPPRWRLARRAPERSARATHGAS